MSAPELSANLGWSKIPFGISELKKDAAVRYSHARTDSLIRADQLICCIDGCDQTHGKRRRGQRASPQNFCPVHGISISVKPTYVFQNYESNFVVAKSMLKQMHKVEKWRLGNETSEDALTWNVFISFYVLGGLKQIFEKFTGISVVQEPELYLWGNRIADACSFFGPLHEVRSRLEQGMGIPTEPDIMLRVPGQALVLIEAKFGSLNGTFEKKEKRFGKVANFLERYACKSGHSDPLNRKWIAEQSGKDILEQLCRNVIFAQQMAAQDEEPFVINLIRRNTISFEEIDNEKLFLQHLSGNVVRFARRTWEDLYALPIVQTEEASTLRQYLENKTLNLRPAFELPSLKKSLC